MNPVNANLSLDLIELDSALAVPTHTWDDAGNKKGPNPNYEADLERVKDMTFFQLRMIFGTQQRVIKSPNSRAKNRRHVLRALMQAATKSIVSKVME